MPVLASGIGAVFEPRAVTVTPRMTLAYAACLGCEDNRYLDDTRNGGLMAPPPFCVSLEWLLAGDPIVRSQLGITDREALNAVHAGQSTRFHRPLFAGETVNVTGRVRAVRPTRAGALVTNELVIFGAGPEDSIASTLSDILYRGTPCDAGVDRAPKRPDAREATEYTGSKEIFIPRTFPHIYAECAAIWNPIHTERRVALKAGLPDIIVHGTALWALAWKHFSDARGEVAELAARFSAMAIPGRPIRLRESPAPPGENEIAFRIDNDAGAPALSAGRVKYRGE